MVDYLLEDHSVSEMREAEIFWFAVGIFGIHFR